MKALEKILLGLTIGSALSTGLLAFALILPVGFTAMFYTLAHLLPFMVTTIAITYKFLFIYAPILIFVTASLTLGSGLLTITIKNEQNFRKNIVPFKTAPDILNNQHHCAATRPLFHHPALFSPTPSAGAHPIATSAVAKNLHSQTQQTANIPLGVVVTDLITEPLKVQEGMPLSIPQTRPMITTGSQRPILSYSAKPSESGHVHFNINFTQTFGNQNQTNVQFIALHNIQHQSMTHEYERPRQSTQGHSATASCSTTQAMSYWDKRHSAANATANQVVRDIDNICTSTHTSIGKAFLAALHN